jgi:carbon-monoxide dehydrogenase large subunit
LRFTALRAVIVGDTGAYSSNPVSCLTEAYQAARGMPGVYRIPAYEYHVVIGLTNKSPISAYRGVGYSVSQCARELLIDDAARQLSVDPFELRMRNIVTTEEMPYTSVAGWRFRDASFVESVSKAHELLLTDSERADDDPPDKLVGRGISPYVEPTGVGTEGGLEITGLPVASFDATRVTVDLQGHATVSFGSPSLGQGLETSIAQVAADALGFDFADVSVSWTDTSAPLTLSGSRASRTAVVSGGAAHRAAEVIRNQILDVAGELLEANPADLALRQGQVWVAGEAGPSATVREVIEFHRSNSSPESGLDGNVAFEATRSYDPPSNYSNACVAAEVEIDRATGHVALSRLIAVEDCGTMINPAIVEGQFIGATAQAVGSALFEQVTYSAEGQPLIGTLMDYLLPTATDVVNPRLSHIDNPSGDTIAGMKGMGESGMIGTVAAIACAVADAIAPFGSVERLPLLPGTVWAALHDEGGP